ncbi:peroxidase family protein [Actinomycetospora lemnae]|uniref:Heme peroxidase family protein n=1 Tax=Actinomycetospora lemnae TaxID=3019891 RepID=A0ABT5T1Q9_9PSEU|nr:heme peroxidase family protein [Actinomycetospora sp. DW7H6]MDD7969042.1 heme peroxidase family protein [Actinomycetospora sp. DW7H6]
MADKQGVARVVRNLRHGGHALPKEVFDKVVNGDQRVDVSLLEDVAAADTEGTPFGYLFADLAATFPSGHLPPEDPEPVVSALKALGAAMIDGDPGDGPDVNSTIRPVYTYWGQFIDHDLTANTDRDDVLAITRGDMGGSQKFVALHPTDVVQKLRNLRQPALNLDSLYGDGPGSTEPDAVPYQDGKRFVLGLTTPLNGAPPFAPVPPVGDTARDLPRDNHKVARIGDGRNDENLIVAQLHVAFLRFHNEVVSLVEAADPTATDEDVFTEARRLVRWTYQWLVVHDFLETITKTGTVAAVLSNPVPLFDPQDADVFMPLEFSVAAFRFGHSMVRGAYDWNRNFGVAAPGQPAGAPRATFEQLFQFTGKPKDPGFSMAGAPTLPANWPAEWDRLVDVPSSPPGGVRFARKIDTRLVPALFSMINEGQEPADSFAVRAILKNLAMRNLLRGYKLAIPSGQAVVGELRKKLNVTGQPDVIPEPLSTAQLLSGPNQAASAALANGGFLTDTPLWFYLLKEAEVEGGNALGTAGSRIVAETIIGQIRKDPESYLRVDPAWTPVLPNGRTLSTIKDLLEIAGVLFPGGAP